MPRNTRNLIEALKVGDLGVNFCVRWFLTPFSFPLLVFLATYSGVKPTELPVGTIPIEPFVD